MRKLIEIKLLGEQLATSKQSLRVQRQVVAELAGTRQAIESGFQELIESGDERAVTNTLNVYIRGGWLDAYGAYEALLAVVRGQGLRGRRRGA